MNEHFPISDEQVQFYQENGYIQLHNVLDAEEVNGLRIVLAQAVRKRKAETRKAGPREKTDYEKVFLQMVNIWQGHEGIRPYVLSERLAEIARRLSKSRNIRLFHDHALIKEPGDSKRTPWHQDLPYWPMKGEGALSCWLALDDVTVGNGCLHFIPRSHRLGRLAPINLGNPQELLDQLPEEKRAAMQPVIMNMKAGSCTFHDGLTFHSAGSNQTKRPRRALAIVYIPNYIKFDKAKPHVCTHDVDYLVDDKPFRGERFPILARANGK